MYSVNAKLSTDGSSLWSNRVAVVGVTELEVAGLSDELDFGELRVCFDTADWDVDEHGLIYTDDRFLAELRSMLVFMGLTRAAADDVDYSEQGMQGDNYVSLDIGEKFIAEWFTLGYEEMADVGLD